MQIAGHDIAVCSWSLQPKDMADLLGQIRMLGLEHVQLAMGPLLELDEAARQAALERLAASGVSVTAGMMAFSGEDYSTVATIRETGGFVPDQYWPARREMMLQAATLTKGLGVKLLSVHVGFIPPSNHPNYGVMIQRLRDVAVPMGDQNLGLLMETGQEPAAELLQFINDLALKNVFVNFDPANMILYGAGDPIQAVSVLGRHIRHVHIKDGKLSSQPGVMWGEEVPFGTGQVGPTAFLTALKSVGYTGPLAIEREAGTTRLADIRTALQALQQAAV